MAKNWLADMSIAARICSSGAAAAPKSSMLPPHQVEKAPASTRPIAAAAGL